MIINRKRLPRIIAKLRQTIMEISKGINHVSEVVVDKLLIDAVRVDEFIFLNAAHR